MIDLQNVIISVCEQFVLFLLIIIFIKSTWFIYYTY